MEKCGVTSAFRQMKKTMKEKGNEQKITIKEKGVLQELYKWLKLGRASVLFEKENADLLNKERLLNNQHGSVNFFILPTDKEVAIDLVGNELPWYYTGFIEYFKGINQTNISQGMDIWIIPIEHEDRILDIQKKIFKILEENYKY